MNCIIRGFYYAQPAHLHYAARAATGRTRAGKYFPPDCYRKGQRMMEKKTLLQTITDNAAFVAEFIAIVAALVLVAYLMEKAAKKKEGSTERILTTRKVAVCGMFAAIAAVLMVFEFPVPFAPPFYGLDFSELPALIGTFAFGPVAGVLIEFCKIVLKVLFKPTSTAFVGELANFAVGCSYLLPASAFYLFHKTRKNAIAGVIAGTLCMTVFGTAFNAVYLLPKFAQMYGMPLEGIVAMGTEINPAIHSVTSLVALAVAPLNLLKGGLVSLITILIYKKISPIIKEGTKKQGK